MANSSRRVVTVWFSEHLFPTHSGEPYLAPLRRVAEEFGRRHPQYHVAVEGHHHQELPADVARAVARGEGPDLAEYYTSTEQLARDTYTPRGTPYFTPIGPLLAGRRTILGEPVVVDDIEPVTRAFFTAEHTLQSMPTTVTTALLYCNTALLERAGVAQVPRTWEDLAAACAAVAALPDAPAHRVTWPTHGWLFQQAVAQQGGWLADNANGHGGRALRVDLASKELLAWVSWWKELHDNGHFLPTDDWGTAFEEFVTGRVAFTISTSKLAREYVAAGAEAGFGVAVAPMPFNAATMYAGNTIAGHSLWLAADRGPDIVDGALAFTQFLVNPDNAARWHREVGFTPVTRAAYARLDRDGWFDLHPQERVATAQLRAASPSPATAGALLGDFAGIQETMARAMDDVLAGRADATDRFVAATSEAQRALDAHNRACLASPPRTPDRLAVY